MKPAPFEYAAPHSLPEALDLLGRNDPDEVKILAGGQSLMPLLNMRLARPELVLDLGRVEGLDYVEPYDGGLLIGAMATKRAVEDSPLVREQHPLLREATVAIGHPPIRNRGTVGGSMVQADPASEYPAVALALDMEFVLVSAGGERVVAADDFFVTFLTTSIEPGEILTEVRVPRLPSGTGWGFQEQARRHGDFAMVGAVATVALEGGVCVAPRLVLFGVADRATRMAEAEAGLAGVAPDEAAFEAMGEAVLAGVEEPMSDVHASAEYRRDLARVLSIRAMREAVSRATG
ncbi:MAG: xanthine dehydrogenase family protein subunit M [Myxococcota bacterium]|nr:xanthine dehydrogenase family protein subunit M [Myxococcota bacterium]